MAARAAVIAGPAEGFHGRRLIDEGKLGADCILLIKAALATSKRRI